MTNWDDPNSPSGHDTGDSNYFGDLSDPVAEPDQLDDIHGADAAPVRPAVPETPPLPDAEESDRPARRDGAFLERLENEWRRLQRTFAYHPHVRVIPLEGDPPDQYQIDYRFRTMLMDENGQLQYSTTCSVHVWLPPEFPHEPPLVRPVSELFHPNVVPEGVNIDRFWTSTRSTLVEVVAGVGTMLCYQDFDLDNAWNPVAAEWVRANPRILPLDPDANLQADAGGDPLQRICRYGPRTMEQTRQQLKQMCDTLLVTGKAPDEGEVRNFAEKTRQSLSLFIEQDVPDELRIAVGDLDDFAGELPASLPTWEGLRRYRDNAAVGMQIARRLHDTEKSIDLENRTIDALVTKAPPTEPRDAMRILPAVDTLETHQQNLEGIIARTDQIVAEARASLSRIGALHKLSANLRSTVLQKRLDAEIERASAAVIDAREKLKQALASLEPVLTRGKVYAHVVRCMIDWRGYADMIGRAEELSGQVLGLGPAGMEAYFIENESGRFGPFEIEQPLTLGSASLIVRNPALNTIELVAADSGKTLLISDDGKAALPITDAESGSVFRTTFELSANCEELAMQLDYVARETTMLFEKLRTGARSPKDCWLGAFNDLLSAQANLGKIQAEHDRSVRRWETLRDDLRSLRPFKDRLVTFRLIQHIHGWAGPMVETIAADKKIEKETTARISQIASGCNTNMETGELLVPRKFAQEYSDLLDKRDKARQELSQLADNSKRAVLAIGARINTPQFRGSADLPQLLLLGALPEAWPELLFQLTNNALGAWLTELEGPLQSKLKPEDWPVDLEHVVEEEHASEEHAEHTGRPETPEDIVSMDELPPAPPVDGEPIDWPAE